MYSGFKTKISRSLYLPAELYDVIEQRARDSFCSFNQIAVGALLRVFLPHTVPSLAREAPANPSETDVTSGDCLCLPRDTDTPENTTTAQSLGKPMRKYPPMR